MHLRLVGAMLPRTTLLDIVRPAGRLIALGLTVSAVTGLLLFAGRASEIAANGIFQTKISLIVIAAMGFLGNYYFRIQRDRLARAAGGVSATSGLARTPIQATLQDSGS